MQSNMLNYLYPSKTATSLDAFKVELVHKISYDDSLVFQRLGVVDSDDLVMRCARALRSACADEINELKDLALEASNRTLDFLESDEIMDRNLDQNKEEKSGNHGSTQEKKMYEPLTKILNYIGHFHGSPLREFRNTKAMFKADEPHTFGFPSCSPDLTITPLGEKPLASRIWRDRDAFGEVKPSPKQGPKPATPGTVPSIVTQASDYARLFMSARPFMLFCVGILIFGTEVCVGIFDRDGVTFSPAYDMFTNADIFVGVVRRLACHLSIQELGHDPTVKMLTDLEMKALTLDLQYPSAVVPSGYNNRRWCTIGAPLCLPSPFWDAVPTCGLSASTMLTPTACLV